MNKLKQCIFSWVDTQKAIDKKKQDAINHTNDTNHAIIKQAYVTCTNIINSHLDTHDTTITKFIGIAVGDTCILNKYAIKYDGYNGWDSGPSAIIDNYEHNKPITVKIKTITISRTLTCELIADFLDNIHDLVALSSNPNILINRFDTFCTYDKKYSELPYLANGKYINMGFELIDIDATQTWGLNAHSFLNIKSTMGKETLKLWNNEFKINELRETAVALEDEMTKTKIRLGSKRMWK